MATRIPDEERHKRTSAGQEAQDTPQLPMKLLVLAELTARDPSTGLSPTSSGRLRIDKDNFNELMARLVGRAVLEVRNRLEEIPRTLLVEIPLQDLRSFRPEAIAEQVPSLKNLLELRNLVVQWRDRKITPQDLLPRLRQWHASESLLERLEQALSAAPPASATTPPPPVPSQLSVPEGPQNELGQDALEALLDMVELPETAERTSPVRAESVLDQVISRLVRPDKPAEPVDRRSADAVLADIDALISAQVDDILHHAEFRRLEAIWRGLKFLVDRTDFRQDIQVEVLSVAKTSLLDTFHQSVFEPEYQGMSEAPLSVVVAAYEFDRSQRDIELLQQFAQMLEKLQVPCLTSVGPAFFGLDSAEALHRLPYASEYLQRPEYVKWNGFRDSEASRWISVVCNRVLLRLPYSTEGERVRPFDFRETLSAAGEAYLWGNPVWAVASLLTGSFARIGWPTEICGFQHGGAIEDLPVRVYQPHGAEAMMLPLEAWITEQLSWDLAENGFLTLTCRPNSDVAVVLSAPSGHRAEHYTDARATADSMLRATLPYQLLASRLVHLVSLLCSQIIPGNTPEGVASDFARALRRSLSRTGDLAVDAIQVEVMASQKGQDSHDLILRVRPGRQVLGGRAVVELRLQVRL